MSSQAVSTGRSSGMVSGLSVSDDQSGPFSDSSHSVAVSEAVLDSSVDAVSDDSLSLSVDSGFWLSSSSEVSSIGLDSNACWISCWRSRVESCRSLIACCSWGVMVRLWPSFNCSEAFITMVQDPSLGLSLPSLRLSLYVIRALSGAGVAQKLFVCWLLAAPSKFFAECTTGETRCPDTLP